MPRQVIPRLYRLKGSSRAVPFVEDIAVPPEALPDFLVRVQNVLKSRQITAALFCHAMHGQLHIRPFLDIAREDDVLAMQPLAEDLYRETLDAGGTISGEHGDGLSRTWFVERQAGPLYPLMREVKRIFDPQNILNPGKVIAEAPQAVHDRLRMVSAASPPPENGTAAETAPAPLIGRGAASAAPVAARIDRLERHAHMRLAIGLALLHRQAAEPEVLGRRVADRPLAGPLGQLHQAQSLGLLLDL